jgi:hypothetical protein
MPGQYWGYGFPILAGMFVLPFTLNLAAGQLRWLAALAALPRAGAGAEDEGAGAVHRGVLEGEIETTPLGRAAVAWIGDLKRTFRRGKGSYTATICRRGKIAGLSLAEDGRRLALGAPELSEVNTNMEISSVTPRRPFYWLGPTEVREAIPDAVLARCRLDRAEVTKNADTRFTYEEQVVPAGTTVEVAACASRDGGLAACASGPAIGQLSAPGMHALLRRLADGVVKTAALLGVVCNFFTVVGAIGSVVALRASAAARGAPS